MAGAEPWTLTSNGLTLAVRVTPKGGRNQIDGVWHDADGQAWLSMRVSAPPADGAANDAIISMLCIHLSVKKRDVELASGASSRLKRFRISGPPERLANAVAKCMGGQ